MSTEPRLIPIPFPTATVTNLNQQFPNIFCLASPSNWLLSAIVGALEGGHEGGARGNFRLSHGHARKATSYH